MPLSGFMDKKQIDRGNRAKRLAALAKTMQIENFLLTDRSYGGGVAMTAALHHPENLAGMVLICLGLVLKDNENEPNANLNTPTATYVLSLKWVHFPHFHNMKYKPEKRSRTAVPVFQSTETSRPILCPH